MKTKTLILGMLAIASVPFTSCSQDDDNYEDTKVEFDLKKGQNKIEIPHLNLMA